MEAIQLFIMEFEKGPGIVTSQRSVCETKAKQLSFVNKVRRLTQEFFFYLKSFWRFCILTQVLKVVIFEAVILR